MRAAGGSLERDGGEEESGEGPRGWGSLERGRGEGEHL